jgi:hypothetical protein
MPNNNELRQVIKTTLNEFETTSLRDASIALLKTLDYQSDKTIPGSRYFCESLFWASQPKQAAKT